MKFLENDNELSEYDFKDGKIKEFLLTFIREHLTHRRIRIRMYSLINGKETPIYKDIKNYIKNIMNEKIY